MIAKVKGNPKLVPSPWALFGNALQLDGKADYVDCGTGLSFVDGKPFTIEIKAKISDFSNWPIILARWGPSYAQQNFTLMVLNDGRLHFVYRTGPKSFLGVDGPRIFVDTPYDIAVVMAANGDVNVFANGQPGYEDNGKAVVPDLNVPLTVGAGAGYEFVGGVIDELRISSTARYALDAPYAVTKAPFVYDEATLFLCHFDALSTVVE